MTENELRKDSEKVRELSKKQLKELLATVGKTEDDAEGFVIGEKKEIYDKGLSLDDIINGN